jgi:heat shock protein HslJ
MKPNLLTHYLALALFLGACGGSAGSLDGTSWALTELNGKPVVEGSPALLSFSGETVSGNASCNQFGGAYSARGGRIEIRETFSTLMACLDGGLMEQETAYLSALQAAEQYELRDGNLLLMNSAGAVTLVFMPMPEKTLTTLRGAVFEASVIGRPKTMSSQPRRQ